MGNGGHWDRHEKAAATTQTVATARTSERRHGPGREHSSRRSTATEDRQGRGGGARAALHGDDPGDPLLNRSSATSLMKSPEGVSQHRVGQHLCWPAGVGPAAHREAHRRRLSLRADSRCAGAVDGGTAGGCRDTLPDGHWHQESKGHRDSDKFFVETRAVDEAGHVLDVQVKRVMRASVARLGYEWRRTKKRVKQLVWRGSWSDPCSFCDRWCGLSGGLFGAQCRVPRAGDSGAGAAGF